MGDQENNSKASLSVKPLGEIYSFLHYLGIFPTKKDAFKRLFSQSSKTYTMTLRRPKL